MSGRLKVLALGLILALGGVTPSAQSPTLKSVMREKLANTRGLLDAVITANYQGIDRYVEGLSHITYTEIGSWQANPQADYSRQANAFLASVEGLRKASAARNIDATSSEYLSLVSSCVQCHALVRRSRSVSVTPPGPNDGVALSRR